MRNLKIFRDDNWGKLDGQTPAFTPLSNGFYVRFAPRRQDISAESAGCITLDVTMSRITVRLAFASERESLEALQWRASLANPNDREALLARPDAIELPLHQIVGGGVFVAEQADQVCGFSAILVRADGNAELDALFVEPTCWRQGVGRVLVEHCAIAAKTAGARYLHVMGNPQAEKFYKGCGFQIFGTEHMRFGVGLLMKRALQ